MRIFLFLSALFFFDILICSPSDNSILTVQVKQGTLKGTNENGTNVWKGIRYAQPPVGPLRFKAPQPLPAGKETIDATQYGNIEAQPKTPLRGKGNPSEDCLFLNIWSSTSASCKKPVFFWVHGGGFTMGSGSDRLYDGSSLARNGDIIVVTFNYRLGPLGFLDLSVLDNDSMKFDVNLGLRDQVAALKWVKENISAFGGDPDNITIAGESAGGTSILALMVSPYTKGLFQKAIVESASAKGASDKKSLTSITKEYLQILGISANNISKLYGLPADSFFAATKELAAKYHWSLRDFRIFCPVTGDDFLPIAINEAIKNGAAKDIPMIIGTNKDECNLFAILRGNKPTPEKTTKFLTAHGFKDIQSITSLYAGYPSRNAMLAILTDGQFRIQSIQSAEAQSMFAPVYMYRFDWTSSTLRSFGLNACHGVELPFVFGSFYSGLGSFVKLGANHHKVQALNENMQASWINFIRTGNPNTDSFQWPKYDAVKRNTLIFDNKIQIVSDPASARRVAWGEWH